MENNQSVTSSDTQSREFTFSLVQYRIAQVFIVLLLCGILILIIGGVWSIGDLFSTDKFGLFVTASLYIKIFIIGAILLGLFILCIFLAVFYRRGRDSLLKMLFMEKTEHKNIEAYFPAKLITAGTLISIFSIFLGLIITFFQSGAQNTQPFNFNEFFNLISGGNRVLVIGGIIFGFTLFILLFLWIWQNGYYFIISSILQRNIKITSPYTFNNSQKKPAYIFYSIFVIGIIASFIGIIWAILDALQPSGTWQQVFLTYSFGLQLSIFSVFVTGFFSLLILLMMIFKRGNLLILTAIFVKGNDLESESGKINNFQAKIIAIGIMISIFLLLIALIIWLFSIGLNLSLGQELGGNIFLVLQQLSGGLLLLSIGIIILVFLFLILSFIYIFNNGYSLLIKKIALTQEKMDKNLTGSKNTNSSMIDKEKKTYTIKIQLNK